MKEKEIKHNKHMNNKNEEVFITTIKSYTFSDFFCIWYAKHCFLKNTDPQNQILFLFCGPIEPIFYAVLPIDQKK